jgi:serine/threonine-protein kinase RsbT
VRDYATAAGRKETIAIASSGDVVKARQAVRSLAQKTGLSLVNQTKLVTAASELGRNTLMYGGGGRVEIAVVTVGTRAGVWARFEDEGPGIEDTELALTDGWTSGSGMGLGLSGARRLVDEFEIESSPGIGTTVSVVKWAR